ncbi:hypothetical protein QQS21_000311 [Conoideocrella luteorostrata]|uniref:Uncharacterized protein n=1 Tax=Conoideocrella luteorostrata TaxID=1105319 RepID=A0AAJ0FYK1_9HYPO|nr:hypothetical protein QQS21_000311 [Conoideocrella luteorostrata]
MSTNSHQRELVMRPNWVFDADGKPISAAAEPLSRWDHRPPDIIFHEGFRPRRAPMSIDQFRKIDDVELHIHRSELIRTATEYDDTGRILSTWYNTRFNPLVNGDQNPQTYELPSLPDKMNIIHFPDTSHAIINGHLLPSDTELVTSEQIKTAEAAERISAKEFEQLTKNQAISFEKWFKSLSEARQKLGYKPVSFIRKNWEALTPLKKTAVNAGGIVWVNGIIQAFGHNTTVLEWAAVVTEIVPFLGCGVRAKSKAVVKGFDPLDTALCLLGDGLLISPYFPLGIMIHIARFLIPFTIPPTLPSVEESQKTRDDVWNEFLKEHFYTHLYSHPLQVRKYIEDKLLASLAVEALAAVSERAQLIGIAQALMENALNTATSDQHKTLLRSGAPETTQNLREAVPVEIIRRQRQCLLNLPAIIKNESENSIKFIAEKFNEEVINNATSPAMFALYSKPDITETGFLVADNKEVTAQLQGIAAHLRTVPLRTPGHFDIAFTIGQCRLFRKLSPDILSVQKYMRENVQEKATGRSDVAVNTLFLHHALQVQQLLQGNISESQLSIRFLPQDDAKNARELQTLLALRFGMVMDWNKHKGWENWSFNLEFRSNPNFRELITNPLVPPVRLELHPARFLQLSLGLDEKAIQQVLSNIDLGN